MATSGMDAQLRIWDIRNYKPVHEYFTPRPADAMDMSQRGLLGSVAGKDVQIWKEAVKVKQKAPYMQHRLKFDGCSLQFCPFEDVLGVGHAKGFISLLVPGKIKTTYVCTNRK